MYALTYTTPHGAWAYSADELETLSTAIRAGRDLARNGMKDVCVVDFCLEVVCSVSPDTPDVPDDALPAPILMARKPNASTGDKRSST